MKSTDFLIIGGSAAGTTAGETIRNLQPQTSITIVSDEDHEFYSRVLIPHYIRGKVSREQIFLRKPQWYPDNKIELVKKTKAVKLDSQNHTVNFSSGEQIKYGKLLISIGGYVVPLKIPGSDSKNIFYMRTVEDADAIIKAAKQAKSAVIIGGGFIGLEFTSCFKVNGVSDVTLLVREDYYWKGKLDKKSAQVLSNTLKKNGITIETNEEADHFDYSNNQSVVVTKSGNKYQADVVGVGIGIRSDLSWLDGSGIKIDRAIVTNEYLETNVPDIYAAGDCAQFKDVIFEREHILGNWANATSQGNAVGKTMALTSPKAPEGQAGQRTVFETASSYSINFFDGSCTFIGVADEDYADEIIVRGSVENHKMTRIFVKTINNVMRVMGATVINSTPDVAPLTVAVKSKVDISQYKDELANAGFDLKNLTL